MTLIVYLYLGYNSFISVTDADTYFEGWLNASAVDTANKEADPLQSYRSMQELDNVVDLFDAAALQALSSAKCEQALHEIRNDLDELQASSVSLGGLVSVKLKNDGQKPLQVQLPRLGHATPAHSREHHNPDQIKQ